jgi:pilus assembly protein CpaC
MISKVKIASTLACLAFLGGVIFAASADSSVDYNSGPIWIGAATGSSSGAPPIQVASTDATIVPELATVDKQVVVASANDKPQVITPPAADPAALLPTAGPVPNPGATAAVPQNVDTGAPPAGPDTQPVANTDAADAPTAPGTQVSQNLIITPPKAPTPSLKPVLPRQTQIAPQPQTSPPTDATTPPGSQANVTFTGTSGKDLAIEINRGALVRLQVPADTVFIANPEIADIQVKSPRLIYVYGKRAGETVLYAVDGNDNLLLNTRVVVTHNIQALRTALNSVAPGGGVAITSAGDALVLEGSVNSAAQAEDIRRLAVRFAPGDGAVVNNLHVVAPNQVNLRVRIAEVSRDTLKQFGINWDNAVKLGGFVFGLATGSPVVNTAAGADFGKTIVRNNGTNSIAGSFRKGNVDLNTVIDALANENLITVLAEPNLTAMSGETANFLAGGEFPIPVPQSGSGNAITVEFKKFGVSLAFTPTVVDGTRINLKVRPEVSQLSTVGSILVNSISIPALTTRNAETTVELASGQSFAIAGLLQHNSQQDASKTPFLGDVPILGALFKSDRYQRNETEQVIVVTPYLVKPESPNAIATPVDGLTPPTDMQRIFYGTKNQQKLPEAGNAPRARDGNTVIGPAGFQLD